MIVAPDVSRTIKFLLESLKFAFCAGTAQDVRGKRAGSKIVVAKSNNCETI